MKILQEINEAAKEETKFSADQKKDMRKLAAQYVESGRKSSEIRNAAGDDLEMLEYSPDEVSAMVPEVIRLYKERKKK